ncbi:hypothetical protein B6R96_32990 [Streptomyces sp. Sge12]|nr:hypothetical protein B6R96_32990 [Streptomyces sp. Sge12]
MAGLIYRRLVRSRSTPSTIGPGQTARARAVRMPRRLEGLLRILDRNRGHLRIRLSGLRFHPLPIRTRRRCRIYLSCLRFPRSRAFPHWAGLIYRRLVRSRSTPSTIGPGQTARARAVRMPRRLEGLLRILDRNRGHLRIRLSGLRFHPLPIRTRRRCRIYLSCLRFPRSRAFPHWAGLIYRRLVRSRSTPSTIGPGQTARARAVRMPRRLEGLLRILDRNRGHLRIRLSGLRFHPLPIRTRRRCRIYLSCLRFPRSRAFPHWAGLIYRRLVRSRSTPSTIGPGQTARARAVRMPRRLEGLLRILDRNRGHLRIRLSGLRFHPLPIRTRRRCRIYLSCLRFPRSRAFPHWAGLIYRRLVRSRSTPSTIGPGQTARARAVRMPRRLEGLLRILDRNRGHLRIRLSGLRFHPLPIRTRRRCRIYLSCLRFPRSRAFPHWAGLIYRRLVPSRSTPSTIGPGQTARARAAKVPKHPPPSRHQQATSPRQEACHRDRMLWQTQPRPQLHQTPQSLRRLPNRHPASRPCPADCRR